MENRSSEDPYNVMRECFLRHSADSVEPLKAVLLDWTRNMRPSTITSRAAPRLLIRSSISSTEVFPFVRAVIFDRTHKGTEFHYGHSARGGERRAEGGDDAVCLPQHQRCERVLHCVMHRTRLRDAESS